MKNKAYLEQSGLTPEERIARVEKATDRYSLDTPIGINLDAIQGIKFIVGNGGDSEGIEKGKENEKGKEIEHIAYYVNALCSDLDKIEILDATIAVFYEALHDGYKVVRADGISTVEERITKASIIYKQESKIGYCFELEDYQGNDEIDAFFEEHSSNRGIVIQQDNKLYTNIKELSSKYEYDESIEIKEKVLEFKGTQYNYVAEVDNDVLGKYVDRKETHKDIRSINTE